MNLGIHHALWAIGAIIGAFIGAVGAPTWEMAFVPTAAIGAMTGAITAQVSILGLPGWIVGAIASTGGAVYMLHLASSTPESVATRCAIAVFSGAAISGAVGILLGRQRSS